jgi:hypothetical protein
MAKELSLLRSADQILAEVKGREVLLKNVILPKDCYNKSKRSLIQMTLLLNKRSVR